MVSLQLAVLGCAASRVLLFAPVALQGRWRPRIGFGVPDVGAAVALASR